MEVTSVDCRVDGLLFQTINFDDSMIDFFRSGRNHLSTFIPD